MKYEYSDNGARANSLANVKRIVVKVGSKLLMDMPNQTAMQRIEELVSQIHTLKQRGFEVIIVSSGAIATGMTLLQTKKRPKSLALLQAHAAVGQCHLMQLYENAAAKYGFHCAQMLLTAADVHDQERHTYIAQCLDAILKQNALPVINENDSICVDEIKIGDNDTLAALVAGMMRADLTVLLTTVDGMAERDSNGKLGKRISVVQEMDADFLAMAQGTDGNSFSVGGMITKLRAATMVTRSGEALWIADGTHFDVLNDVFSGKDSGTLFVPIRKGHMHARQRFLAFFSEPHGDIIIDRGAEHALKDSGKSLLPRGILGVSGNFKRGDTVRILNVDRTEIARGMVNYSNADLALICGCQTAELPKRLGRQPEYEEAIHRDFLVLN